MCIWDGMAWRVKACIYKGEEIKMVNGNAKSFFVCERDEKSWNIESNETNNSLKTLDEKCNKSSLETLNQKKYSLYF